MKKIYIFILFLSLAFACGGPGEYKVRVYGWLGGPGDLTDLELMDQFMDLRNRGIDGLMYGGGQDPETYRRVGKIAGEAGLEFQAWIPAMVQLERPELGPGSYAVNGLGESAFDKPAYVAYYRFLCPARTEVYRFLSEMYGAVAEVDEVDGIHLDYIRFPDVILPRGLWEKYDLVMDREYPEYDYCYCDICVTAFRKQYGIDIKKSEDPSQIEEWNQFRCDLITEIVNRLVGEIHRKGKIVSAAVFPGPDSVARKIVRQEWDRWDLDAVYPMNYNDFYLEDTEWIGQVTREGVTAVQGRMPLFSGLFICSDPGGNTGSGNPESRGLVPGNIGTAIRESMENGAAGICLFTPGKMTDAHWAEFDKAIRIDYSDE